MELHHLTPECEVVLARLLSGGLTRVEKSYLGFLACQGRTETVREIQQTLFKEPQGDVVQQQLITAELSMILGQPEEAEQLLLFALHLSPGHVEATSKLAEIYEALGQPKTAHKIVCTLKERTSCADDRAIYWGLMGHTQQASRLLSQTLRQRSVPSNYRHRVLLGKFLVRLAIGSGQLEEAAHWLEETVLTEHDPYSLWLNVDPLLRHLHPIPAFRELVIGKMQLAIANS